MTTYVALLRGITPTNPAMRNENLRRVVEGLGYRNVRTVISSGNVLFESDAGDPAEMEARLEVAWPDNLGFTSTTIIRSRQQLERLVAADPFRGIEHGPASYLLATFLKKPPALDRDFPITPPGKPYRLEMMIEGTLLSITDTTAGAAADVMVWLDREFGKEISSRTWLTVHRLLRKM
jgi:uncharacterized protein (DUF1697 family)